MTSLSSQIDPSPILVWFRRDLRVTDHPALHHALATGRPVIPCFIWAPEEEAPWEPGAASKWWLHHSLIALEKSIQRLGSRLILRSGPTQTALDALLGETGATSVYWNRLYEPAIIHRDAAVKKSLRDRGLDAQSFNGHLLHEPWTILNQQDKPYQVFTPFYRMGQTYGAPDQPLPAPSRLPAVASTIPSCPVRDLDLLPRIEWAQGLDEAWTPGEHGAEKRLARFSDGPVGDYTDRRDIPSDPGTSRLSPHLHFGEVSPRQVWYRCHKHAKAEPYLRQLVWRDFGHHLLYHFPHTADEPLRPDFKNFPWDRNAKALKAWQTGHTGYPIVDAGMRELWHTGWMHNRVRMIVASFLVKDLLISWKEGARWFWDTLVDADLANNTLGWQWAGGCGADAAPYFRIFNPELQSKKFDAEGSYIATWIPELAKVPAKQRHHPSTDDLFTASSQAYPKPMVDHKNARDRALEAFHTLKKT